jgi:hypothetical protein
LLVFAHGASAADDGGGKWSISLDTASDGSKIITARLPADTPIPSGFDKVTPVLVIRYRLGQTDLRVDFDTFLGSGKLPITVAFAGQPTVEEVWRISSDGRAAVPPGAALAFVERLKQADVVSLSFAPKHHDRVSTQFTTYGIALVMKALISAGVKYGD